MHGFEVSWIFFDDLFEVNPLLEYSCILVGGGRMIVFDELVKLAVEQFDLLLGAFVDFGNPIH